MVAMMMMLCLLVSLAVMGWPHANRRLAPSPTVIRRSLGTQTNNSPSAWGSVTGGRQR